VGFGVFSGFLYRQRTQNGPHKPFVVVSGTKVRRINVCDVRRTYKSGKGAHLLTHGVLAALLPSPTPFQSIFLVHIEEGFLC
jgi:hypothetical protein